jgi:hypothetical protein
VLEMQMNIKGSGTLAGPQLISSTKEASGERPATGWATQVRGSPATGKLVQKEGKTVEPARWGKENAEGRWLRRRPGQPAMAAARAGVPGGGIPVC